MPYNTIAERSVAIRRGETSAEALVETALDAIARHDAALNAFISVFAHQARRDARHADAELAAGTDRGPLHGLPISVKDLIDVAGTPTTAGSHVRASHPATRDADVVARLRCAGAIIVGKCNLHEFALGTTGEDSAFGPTRHPQADDRSPGGSSSGSAVSVATGMAVASIGTDTGGSIRIPAAACGIVGLKPTHGELSLAGVFPLARTLDHVGPLAGTAEDVAIVYRAMGGQPPAAAVSVTPRIGCPQRYVLDVLDRGIRGVIERSIEQLRAAGCTLEPVEIAFDEQSSRIGGPAIASAYRTTVLYEAFQVHQHTLQTQADRYQPAVRDRLEAGRGISHEHYARAQDIRAALRRQVDAALDGRDALVLPTLPITAPLLGRKSVTLDGTAHTVRDLTLRLTQPFNLTGHPAISLPCGEAPDGLPCGLQLVGHQGRTAELLALAEHCEPTVRRRSTAP